MPKLQLTRMKVPRGQSHRWRKKYKGAIFYFRGPYPDALKQWEHKKVELDGQDKAQYDTAIQNRKEIDQALSCVDEQLSPEAFKALADLQSTEQLQAALTSGDKLPLLTKREIDPWLALPLADKEIVRKGMEVWHSTHASEKNIASTQITTIGQAIDEWLTGKKSQVIMGHIRQSTLSSTTNNITYFRNWAGDNTPLSSTNEKLLFDFFNHLAGEIGDGNMKLGYAHQIMLYTKSFIRRQWELHRIELPRNIGSRDLSIRVPTAAISVLSVGDIKAFYNRGTSLLKTCILLSLNCGFNQVDIATLKHSEVDWERGTITKKRVKTGGSDSVPTVQWKLWPATYSLLKKHRTKHPELVLLGRKDRELMQGGGLERVDVIAKMWRYVRGKLGNKLEYKLLRKTASTTLASHPVHGRYAQYFLCHAASSVADKHYVKPSQGQFDDAIKWLGDQFSAVWKPTKPDPRVQSPSRNGRRASSRRRPS
ncbi:MAG: tyrosine-type recombinase/integrase [Thermoguttaceae bacterium]